MVEKGTERHRSANGMVAHKKGHVRIVKNSNHGSGHGCFQSIASSPKAVGKNHSPDLHVDGQAKKGRRSTTDSTGLPLTPNSRQGSPKVASSPKNGSPRLSPSLGCHYAGAKFSEPPSPDSLPKPPTHWTGFCMTTLGAEETDNFREISQQLKMILKVQA